MKTPNFFVKFRHVSEKAEIQELLKEVGVKPRSLPQKATVCTVIGTNSKPEVGISFCSSNDQFVRATGRKTALKKAISNFTREERKEIWQEYFS